MPETIPKREMRQGLLFWLSLRFCSVFLHLILLRLGYSEAAEYECGWAYNACKHYCKYCYANYDERKVEENFNNHYKDSSLLVGKIEKDDIIKVRKQ